jgi:hypothetical protein
MFVHPPDSISDSKTFPLYRQPRPAAMEKIVETEFYRRARQLERRNKLTQLITDDNLLKISINREGYKWNLVLHVIGLNFQERQQTF